MALTCKHDTITSDRTAHSARPFDASVEYWQVSYMRGIRLEYEDAYIAMTIADNPHPRDKVVAVCDWDPRDIRTWVRQCLWADILGPDIDAVTASNGDLAGTGCWLHETPARDCVGGLP